MPKFRVLSQETCFYVNLVEASNEAEAREIVEGCGVDLTVCDGDDFKVTLVEPIFDDAVGGSHD